MSIVKNARLYGNGTVFLGYHHVFVVLQTDDEIYHLLEVVERGGTFFGKLGMGNPARISIKHATSGSLNDVLQARSRPTIRADRWYKSKRTDVPWSNIQELIAKYDGKAYYYLTKNCRHFADEILNTCGLKRRCND
jgi:hypothetical protein